MSPQQIDRLKQYYLANNNIETACANDPAAQIARYDDIDAIHPELSEQLASFFKGLYSQQLLDLAALRKIIGRIDDHYQAFMQVNTTGKCPFCGINDVKGIHHSKREAYDHYLPQALYPFNTINFHNLAPACHECNSAYKLSKDPTHNDAGQRKAFYPYATDARKIEITIDFSTPDIDQMTPGDIRLTIGPAAAQEEIETWKEVYGIDERYKAKCCNMSGGKYWLTQVLDEWQEDGRSPSDYLNTLNRMTATNPLADINFLRKAFLEGCQRAGFFNATAEENATI